MTLRIPAFLIALAFYPAIHAQESSKTVPLLLKTNRLERNERTGVKRILALRVQFKKEEPDRGVTTGNGHFDLGNNTSNLFIDPPPHNKAYFEDQLLAMRNYFFDVSDGKLDIQYTVKPDGDTAAYTLTRFMEYYGIRGTQAARDRRLAEFFRDAVALADTQDAIDFSQFDHVIIFHAGAGEDFAAENATPNDLGSRFISHDLLRSQFGPSYPGVPVQNGTRFITGGVVVPETETQSFIDPVLGIESLREIGLLGILAANYGSRLGMPDLFNTANGSPGIGVFGLEDFGAVNGDGLIPAEPDPWTKIYMGWAAPAIVSDSTMIALQPRKLAGKSLILKIPISASEYYLIENKQRDVIDNTLSPEVIARYDTINLSDGTQVVDTAYFAGIERSGATGVITKVDEFDNALPGRGLLIWHIDEKIIAEKMSSNSINADLDRRGVRLVEGSGSQDIGRAFSGFFGTTIGSGDRFDYFFEGNEGFRFFNKDVDSVFFTPYSVPPALSNDRANTGVHITRIGKPATLMTFALESKRQKKGFPRFMGTTPSSNSLKFADISGDGRPEVISLSYSGEIFAWSFDGQKVVPNTVQRPSFGLGEDSTVYDVALLAQTGEPTPFAPAIADIDNDGKAEIVVGGINGKVSVWKAADTDANGLGDSLFTFQLPADMTCPPLITQDKKIVLGTSDGHITVLNSSGVLLGSANVGARVTALAVLGVDSIVAQTPTSVRLVHLTDFQTMTVFTIPTETLGIAVADADQNGSKDIIAVRDDNLPMVYSDGKAWPAIAGYRVYGSPAVANINQDGFLEVIAGGDNSMVSMNHNGSTTTDFPAILDAAWPRGRVTTQVVIGDVSGEGKPNVVCGTSDGLIYAFDDKGRRVAGFPLSTGSAVQGLALADIDGDGVVDLLATSADGFLYAYDLNVPFVQASMKWPQYLHDAQNTSLSTEKNVIIPVGGDLIPARSAYNYPNPAKGDRTTIRYFLSEPASVTIYVYDLAGDLVEKLEGTGIPQKDNEVNWNLKKIQSGVYIAQIVAKGQSGKRSTRTVKIAVTK